MSSEKQEKLSGEEDTVTGYIHEVSPIKTSLTNYTYFNATLQTAIDDYHRMVVFSPVKHSEFSQAAESCSPVKLNKVSKALSFRQSSTFDVKCNKTTTLEEIACLPFPAKDPNNSEIKDISSLKKDKRSFQHVKQLTAKVTDLDSTPCVKNVRGEDLQMHVIVISDKTDCIKLTLWGHLTDNVSLGLSYKFSNLSTRLYEDVLLLTTTKDSIILQVDDIGEPFAYEQTTNRQNRQIEGKITAVNIELIKICTQCHKTQTDFDVTSKFWKCTSCNMRQLSMQFSNRYRGFIVLMANEGEIKFVISTPIIDSYIQSKNLQYQNSRDIELDLLECKILYITCTQDNTLISMNSKVVSEKEITKITWQPSEKQESKEPETIKKPEFIPEECSEDKFNRKRKIHVKPEVKRSQKKTRADKDSK